MAETGIDIRTAKEIECFTRYGSVWPSGAVTSVFFAIRARLEQGLPVKIPAFGVFRVEDVLLPHKSIRGTLKLTKSVMLEPTDEFRQAVARR